MSLPPITIPDLDPAGPIDPDNDLLLIRQGLNDRKLPAGGLLSPRLTGLQMLPNQLIASDVLLIGRNNGAGYDNYIMPPQYLGFLNGTCTWFWQANAPLGWTVVPNSGDRVLATALPGGAPFQYYGPGYLGTWQQENHTLTVAQIPPHSHGVKSRGAEEASGNKVRGYRPSDTSDRWFTENAGGGQGHNHGATWRPAAAVGILCVKDKLVGQ